MAARTQLTNARLFDSIAGSISERSAILINGERIESVATGETRTPEGAEVVDLGGQTVVPGLIDTHVHYALGGDEAMKLFIANGVTSVRDCGGQLELLKAAQHAISSGEKIGPRLYICGPLLQGRVPALPEPYNSLLAMSVNSPDEVPDKIGAVLGAEVDSLKLYYSLPTETGERVIGYAGGEVPVTGHLGWMPASVAVRAGINGLEHASISPYADICPVHMSFSEKDGMFDRGWLPRLQQGWIEADLSAPAARDLIKQMADRQVALGTLMAVDWIGWSGREQARSDPDRRYIVPAHIELQRRTAQARGHGLEGDWDLFISRLPEPDAVRARRAIEKQLEFCQRLHDAGGLIVGGTDAGGIGLPPPGFSLLRELEMLSMVMGPVAALRAVTYRAACYLRKQTDIGSVERGRYADLMVVNGNPLVDVRHLRKVTAVYKGGVRYDPKELLATLPPNPNFKAEAVA
jgi:cytosine/adenosine deaminase-related metal-dependent hydrolase